MIVTEQRLSAQRLVAREAMFNRLSKQNQLYLKRRRVIGHYKYFCLKPAEDAASTVYMTLGLDWALKLIYNMCIKCIHGLYSAVIQTAA